MSDAHVQSLEQFHLFSNLVDSNCIVDESVLDKLKFNIRSMLASDAGKDKALLDLCLDVIYHSNMKAYGLQNLINLFNEWEKERREVTSDDMQADNTADMP